MSLMGQTRSSGCLRSMSAPPRQAEFTIGIVRRRILALDKCGRLRDGREAGLRETVLIAEKTLFMRCGTLLTWVAGNEQRRGSRVQNRPAVRDVQPAGRT